MQEGSANIQSEIQSLLRERFTELQEKNAKFSLRSYAKRLALQPSTLSEILNGRRVVTRNLALRVAERLTLAPELIDRWVSLLPRRALRQITPVIQTPAKDTAILKFMQLSTDEFNVIADWYYFAVLSLVQTKEFVNQVSWIAQRLGIQQREAQAAIDTLLRLGLLEQTSEGKWKTSGKPLKTTTDVPSHSIRKNHAQGLELAREALDQVPVEQREFGAITFPADPAVLPEAKRRIREFRKEISQLFDSGTRTEVLRFSVQLFPLTKRETTQEGSKS